ncbi:hypothetical protein QJS10_CPA01g02747 [Acorus calamus]|uniref:Uncharacterized protein n=1 Tax=Acorus calamus TaxID=4465 RepID=A0AAV9FFS6_ACOCL|nr:hypothetical protein QJS10_CPA01g02747 [Acorus calamus]
MRRNDADRASEGLWKWVMKHLLCKKPSPTVADAVNHPPPPPTRRCLRASPISAASESSSSGGAPDSAPPSTTASFSPPPLSSPRQSANPDRPRIHRDGKSFYMDGSLKLRVV